MIKIIVGPPPLGFGDDVVTVFVREFRDGVYARGYAVLDDADADHAEAIEEARAGLARQVSR
jgi:hypothetical protein